MIAIVQCIVMMRRAAVLAWIAFCSTPLLADDHNVDFDLHVDFSQVRTFKVGAGKIASERPELNNALVQTKIVDAIRTALKSRGLTETPGRADVAVEFSVSHVDYSVGPFGVARPIGPNRGGRGRGAGGPGGLDAQSTDPVGFVEGTLVIDMMSGDAGTLIWRGVYRDNEKNSSKFSGKLAVDAKKLLSEYPPKKKK